ncbi:MAG: glutathione synthase [Gammaproteobacteria bacterium]|nr:glutathione synthase [Gammaproteobacteria bacterium]
MNGNSVVFGVVMDPIADIKPYKDSTFAMLLAASARGWTLRYMEQSDLWVENGKAMARTRPLEVRDQTTDWFALGDGEEMPMADLDVVLMRKDPPFDMEYIYTSYILELAQEQGSLVINNPASLRDANEKVYMSWFPQCCADTLITRSITRIKAFARAHEKIVLKPLDGMGGKSIFIVARDDPNSSVIAETLTDFGRQFTMAQQFLPEISETGDKRILLIDGEPVPYALARFPAEGEARGNLAAGGSSRGLPLTERDYWICTQIGQALKEKGLLFVGLDVIGDYMTEINVTSPTCIRELDAEFELDIGGQIMDAIQARLTEETG